MRFLHNPFDKDVDLNTILYRITYPEYFEDLDFADEETPAAEEVIFGHDRDIEAKLTWSYGVDCWRAIYAELDQAKAQVEKGTCEFAQASEKLVQLRDELQKKLDLCLRTKNDLESAAEDARQGKAIDQLILAEKSLPPGSKIYFRKTSVAHWSVQAYDISIPEWSEDQCGKNEPSGYSTQLPHAVENIDEQIAQFPEGTKWETISISLMARNKIRFKVNDGASITLDLEYTKLFDKRKKDLNKQGVLLLGLAERSFAPPGENDPTRNRNRSSISKLRKILKELTRITSDPFYDHNPSDGWRPRFKVLDRRQAADERAKEKAVPIEYKEHHQFAEPFGNPGDQNDDKDANTIEEKNKDEETDRWLQENDR